MDENDGEDQEQDRPRRKRRRDRAFPYLNPPPWVIDIYRSSAAAALVRGQAAAALPTVSIVQAFLQNTTAVQTVYTPALEATVRNTLVQRMAALPVQPFVSLDVLARFRSAYAPTYPMPVYAALATAASATTQINAFAALGNIVSPLNSWYPDLRTTVAGVQPFLSVIGKSLAATSDLLRQWLPDNLRDLDADAWERLFTFTEQDGMCLAWAPRATHITGLLAQPTADARFAYLAEHRDDVLADVESSLDQVEHEALAHHVDFTRQAVACIRQGLHAPAQALLGNILDTVMLDHGHGWLTECFRAVFPDKAGHFARLRIVRRDQPDRIDLLMMEPYLLVSSLSPAFDKTAPEDQKDTFNRHLGAHHLSTRSCRHEFAFTALLTVQALLRQMDGYLLAAET